MIQVQVHIKIWSPGLENLLGESQVPSGEAGIQTLAAWDEDPMHAPVGCEVNAYLPSLEM